MQNFGRGMWRRVGDYEKLNAPIQARIEEWQKFLLYQQQLNRQNELRKQKGVKEEEVKEEEVKEEVVKEGVKEEGVK